jgi:hypothetical protein
MVVSNLLETLRSDFPEISFEEDAELFFYSPSDNCVHIGPAAPHDDLLTLHELAHATLGHKGYSLDIELVRLEVEAWERTLELAAKYHVEADPSDIDEHLESYRDWIFTRSTCPRCEMTGYQDSKRIYHCPHCYSRWHTKINRWLI